MMRVTEDKEQFPITNSEDNNTTSIINNKTSTGSNSKLWSGLKDPRIVRVSKSFGGKDRHSKVNTIRGLRDRRVRLSVPTAIELYDLQDRLGLNQPSKVVDWLLNAAQHEINKLPPLEYPVENFIQFHQSLDQTSKAKSNFNHDDQCFNVEGEQRIEVESPAIMYQDVGIYNAQSSSFHQLDHNLLSNNSRGGGGGDQAALGLINNIGSYHWDHSNKSYFSQFGIISSQVDVAPVHASVFSSYMNTTVPSDQSDGTSAQQNLPMNSNAIFRNCFPSASPKARPF